MRTVNQFETLTHLKNSVKLEQVIHFLLTPNSESPKMAVLEFQQTSWISVNKMKQDLAYLCNT